MLYSSRTRQMKKKKTRMFIGLGIILGYNNWYPYLLFVHWKECYFTPTSIGKAKAIKQYVMLHSRFFSESTHWHTWREDKVSPWFQYGRLKVKTWRIPGGKTNYSNTIKQRQGKAVDSKGKMYQYQVRGSTYSCQDHENFCKPKLSMSIHHYQFHTLGGEDR